jgi:hypothetical protein
MKVMSVLILILAAAWAGAAWALMLEVGVAHRDWWPALPPMGYGVALVIAAIGVGFATLCGIAQVVVKEVK